MRVLPLQEGLLPGEGQLFAADHLEGKQPPLSNIKLTLINTSSFLYIHSLLEELTRNKPKGKKNLSCLGDFKRIL